MPLESRTISAMQVQMNSIHASSGAGRGARDRGAVTDCLSLRRNLSITYRKEPNEGTGTSAVVVAILRQPRLPWPLH
ncbi:MAG: hypothetical protein DME60_10715 [Verrucomicrobia bacterium]|nr:MAG: hypothetical protein DME60_10715 [Verrucomicrobiota bacterium]